PPSIDLAPVAEAVFAGSWRLNWGASNPDLESTSGEKLVFEANPPVFHRKGDLAAIDVYLLNRALRLEFSEAGFQGTVGSVPPNELSRVEDYLSSGTIGPLSA